MSLAHYIKQQQYTSAIDTIAEELHVRIAIYGGYANALASINAEIESAYYAAEGQRIEEQDPGELPQ